MEQNFDWSRVATPRSGAPLLARAAVGAFLRSIDRTKQGVILSSGRVVGNSNAVCIRIENERDFGSRLALDGPLGLGEAFVAGSWSGHVPTARRDLTESMDVVADWLTIYARRFGRRWEGLAHLAPLLWYWRLPRNRTSSLQNARANVSAHYDLPVEFFKLFLDETLTYSCADFGASVSLSAAQIAKVESILDMADVGPGTRLLDVGCGWGFLPAYAAKTRKAHVVGLTLSPSQARVAGCRAAEYGVSDQVDILQTDYRLHRGRYDAVVCVEMVEAVGAQCWREFVSSLSAFAAPNAVAVIQTVTFPYRRMRRAMGNYSWVDKYIFPGGELCSVERFEQLFSEISELEIVKLRRLSSSYSQTLREWRKRLESRLEDAAGLGLSPEFLRVWLLYLAYFEAGFRARYLDVWQMQLRRRREFPLEMGSSLESASPAQWC